MTDGFVQCSAGRISRPATWVIIPRIGSLTSTNWGGPNKRVVTKCHNSHPLYTSRLSRPQKTSFRSGFVHFWGPAWSYWIRGKWVSCLPVDPLHQAATCEGQKIQARAFLDATVCPGIAQDGHPIWKTWAARMVQKNSRGCHEWFVCGVLMCFIHFLHAKNIHDLACYGMCLVLFYFTCHKNMVAYVGPVQADPLVIEEPLV
jgi:hypothetical protein